MNPDRQPDIRLGRHLTTTSSALSRSLDQSGDLAFDVPIKDPLAEMLRAGGSYPFSIYPKIWRHGDGPGAYLP